MPPLVEATPLPTSPPEAEGGQSALETLATPIAGIGLAPHPHVETAQAPITTLLYTGPNHGFN